MLEFARIWQAADKIVYSKSLETVSTPRTRLEREFEPAGGSRPEGSFASRCFGRWSDLRRTRGLMQRFDDSGSDCLRSCVMLVYLVDEHGNELCLRADLRRAHASGPSAPEHHPSVREVELCPLRR